MKPIMRSAALAAAGLVALCGFHPPAAKGILPPFVSAAISPGPVDGMGLADDELVMTPYVLSLSASFNDSPSLGDQSGGRSGISLAELVSTTVELPKPKLSDEMQCLSEAVYFESRGEPIEGQLAVAQVILNRVSHAGFPDTICGVVYEERRPRVCQFSFACDGLPDTPANSRAWQQARAVALIAAANAWADVTDDATYFHATYVRPSWSTSFDRTRQVGRHIFYRD